MLLAGLKLPKVVEANRVRARSDSQLVLSQINGEYIANDKRKTAYLERVRELIKDFTHFEFQKLPRSENAQADTLANLGSTTVEERYRRIFVEFLIKPSINGDLSIGSYICEIGHGKKT